MKPNNDNVVIEVKNKGLERKICPHCNIIHDDPNFHAQKPVQKVEITKT